MRSTAQLPCAHVTKKNDKYALHAKRRIVANGQRLTVSPFARDKESNEIRDLAKNIERLRKSNAPEDKEILASLLTRFDSKEHIQRVEKSVMKRKGLI